MKKIKVANTGCYCIKDWGAAEICKMHQKAMVIGGLNEK